MLGLRGTLKTATTATATSVGAAFFLATPLRIHIYIYICISVRSQIFRMYKSVQILSLPEGLKDALQGNKVQAADAGLAFARLDFAIVEAAAVGRRDGMCRYHPTPRTRAFGFVSHITCGVHPCVTARTR